MPYSRVFYHFIWATKNRLPLITSANRDLIFGAVATKVKEQGGTVHALNGMADHVHLVASVPLTLSLARFVGLIKGSSSHAASHVMPTADSFAWQDEYGVLTVSESHLPTVVRYVQQQQQHHAHSSLDTRLENC